MKIHELPLSNCCRIVAFNSDTYRVDYSLSRDSGTVLTGGKFIATGFPNDARFPNHKIVLFEKLTEKDAQILYDLAKKESRNALIDLTAFLEANGLKIDNTLWLIIPKRSKKLAGQKIKINFSVGSLDFGYGNTIEELDVYISPINTDSKKITFSVRMPEFLYNKCLTNTEIKERPLTDIIESESLSGLHQKMTYYVNMAHSMWAEEKDAETYSKVICINFSSSEKSQKDMHNFAYTGQKINVSFNFFIAYKCKKGLFSFDKLQSGMGVTEKGIAGIVNTKNTSGKNWIRNTSVDVILDWSEEKEAFLRNLESQFRFLSEKLNIFLKDLNEEKLLELMNNNHIKLLPQNAEN